MYYLFNELLSELSHPKNNYNIFILKCAFSNFLIKINFGYSDNHTEKQNAFLFQKYF